MKVLSLKQPWAELILLGRKTIEVRKWNTAFRGEFLIHASGNTDEEAMKLDPYHVKQLKELGLWDGKDEDDDPYSLVSRK